MVHVQPKKFFLKKADLQGSSYLSIEAQKMALCLAQLLPPGWKVEVKEKVTQSCPTLCNPTDYTAHGILQARTVEWVAFPFSRGIFPTQGLNPGLPHCRQILYQLSHQGSPRILAWVAYPFSRGSSPMRVSEPTCYSQLTQPQHSPFSTPSCFQSPRYSSNQHHLRALGLRGH